MEKEGRVKLSRRDFLRLAGVSAAGAAAVTVVRPAKAAPKINGGEFTDAAGRPARPWWVRVVDEPTTEIDWARMARFNERTGSVRGPGMAKYAGEEAVARMGEINAKNELERILGNVDGYTLKDYALQSAHAGHARSFLGPQSTKTPEDRGVPKWSGSPEEAARIIRSAMRHFGAASGRLRRAGRTDAQADLRDRSRRQEADLHRRERGLRSRGRPLYSQRLQVRHRLHGADVPGDDAAQPDRSPARRPRAWPTAAARSSRLRRRSSCAALATSAWAKAPPTRWASPPRSA
jgi:hypothetical protein